MKSLKKMNFAGVMLMATLLFISCKVHFFETFHNNNFLTLEPLDCGVEKRFNASQKKFRSV